MLRPWSDFQQFYQRSDDYSKMCKTLTLKVINNPPCLSPYFYHSIEPDEDPNFHHDNQKLVRLSSLYHQKDQTDVSTPFTIQYPDSLYKRRDILALPPPDHDPDLDSDPEPIIEEPSDQDFFE